MYSLDVNFLNDRAIAQPDKGFQFVKPSLPGGNMTPLYLGLTIGLVLPTLVAGSWLFLQSRNSQLEQETAALDQEISRLGIQEQNAQQLQQQTTQIQAETRSLATVFNQIRPWSAMLQDMRDRIPTTVQIQSLKQTAPESPPPAPAAQPSPDANAATPPAPASNPAGGIEIIGLARSFSDVNDFLLSLQQSPFLNAANTKVVSAELVDAPVPIIGDPQAAATPPKPQQAVQYTIQTSLSDVPAVDLMRELERKGSVGLVTRIRSLQQKGVMQK